MPSINTAQIAQRMQQVRDAHAAAVFVEVLADLHQQVYDQMPVQRMAGAPKRRAALHLSYQFQPRRHPLLPSN
jgi:hypothetical protein